MSNRISTVTATSAVEARISRTAQVHVVIPEGVTTIGNFAFYASGKLTSVSIPESVTTIGDCAFHACKGLTSVTIPNSVTTISDYAFSGCSGLTTVTIPEGVNTIGRSAFRDCSRLSFVIAPAHLRESPNDRFDDCPLLARLEADTDKNRRQSLRWQSWSPSTHQLCFDPQREWVVMMLMLAYRLRSTDSYLPNEMWLMILGLVPRWALGPRN